MHAARPTQRWSPDASRSDHEGWFQRGTRRRIRWFGSFGGSAGILADMVEPLGEAALALEGRCQRGELAVKQAAGYGNESQGGVGGEFREGRRSGPCGRHGLDGRHGLCGRHGLGRGLSVLLARPLGYLVGGGAAAGNQVCPARIFAVPQGKAALAEKVFVIEAQFFEAGAGYVGQLEFGLFGGARGLAALSYVLHSAASGLHHLVVGTAALLDVAVTEADGHVVNQLRHLKTLQLAVAAVPGDERFLLRHESPPAQGCCPLCSCVYSVLAARRSYPLRQR